MASTSATTVDHDEIRKWVEAHDGQPVIVKDTDDERGGGVLRIDFPGGAGNDRLEPVDWDTWFETFDNRKLAFLYQKEKANGDDSTFFKLVER